jgi:hypothetical protein
VTGGWLAALAAAQLPLGELRLCDGAVVLVSSDLAYCWMLWRSYGGCTAVTMQHMHLWLLTPAKSKEDISLHGRLP